MTVIPWVDLAVFATEPMNTRVVLGDGISNTTDALIWGIWNLTRMSWRDEHECLVVLLHIPHLLHELGSLGGCMAFSSIGPFLIHETLSCKYQASKLPLV